MDRLFVVLCGTKFKAHSRSLEVFGDYCCLDFFVRARGDSNERERGNATNIFSPKVSPFKFRLLECSHPPSLRISEQSCVFQTAVSSLLSLSLSRFFLILRPSLVLWLFHVVAVSFSNTV